MRCSAFLLFATLAAALPQGRPKAATTTAAKARPAGITTTAPAGRAVATPQAKPSSTIAAAQANNVAAPAPSASPASTPMNQLSLPFTNQAAFVAAMLDTHNTYRQRHGAKNLTWNPALVQTAVQQLSTQQFKHLDPNEYGENIAMFYRNDGRTPATNNQNPRQQVQWWYDEVSSYDYQKAEYSQATGHFTQIVWKDTQELGCAWDQASGTDGGYTRRLTCEYSPKGNWVGEFADNVLPPTGPMPAPQPYDL